MSFISFRRQENTAVVKGLSAGTARIKASLKETDDSVIFYVRIKEPRVIEEGKPCYLTTSQNSVTIKKGETADIFVTPVNIDGSVLSQIEWKNKTPELFSISANGDSATLTALQEGNGIIEISHPLSKNTLTLNVRVGNEFIYKNTDVVYISSQDIVRLRTDSEEFMLSCILAHTESSLTETQGFHFSSSDKELFVVSYSSNGSYCFITPKKAGQGILKIHHEKASYDKEVLVIIEKSVAELAEIPYLSTSQNVVTVIQGEYITLSASLNNGNSYDPSKWEWITQDGSISDLIVNSGPSAMISGVSPGTTKFSVMHEECLYPLEIIVICMDASSVRENPFIRTSTNIVTLGLGKSQTITAEMIGGENASGNFFWSILILLLLLFPAAALPVMSVGLNRGRHTSLLGVRIIPPPIQRRFSSGLRKRQSVHDCGYIKRQCHSNSDAENSRWNCRHISNGSDSREGRRSGEHGFLRNDNNQHGNRREQDA